MIWRQRLYRGHSHSSIFSVIAKVIFAAQFTYKCTLDYIRVRLRVVSPVIVAEVVARPRNYYHRFHFCRQYVYETSYDEYSE